MITAEHMRQADDFLEMLIVDWYVIGGRSPEIPEHSDGFQALLNFWCGWDGDPIREFATGAFGEGTSRTLFLQGGQVAAVAAQIAAGEIKVTYV